jgi:hypothetical protein
LLHLSQTKQLQVCKIRPKLDTKSVLNWTANPV